MVKLKVLLFSLCFVCSSSYAKKEKPIFGKYKFISIEHGNCFNFELEDESLLAIEHWFDDDITVSHYNPDDDSYHSILFSGIPLGRRVWDEDNRGNVATTELVVTKNFLYAHDSILQKGQIHRHAFVDASFTLKGKALRAVFNSARGVGAGICNFEKVSK